MAIPPVTIVIPTYNASRTLKTTLKAIEELDYPKDRLGVVFVDGGSTDDTLNILREWSKEASRLGFRFVEIIELKQRGVAKARNIGIKEALEKYEAKYIFMLDSDVIPPSYILKTAIDHFSMNHKVGIVAAPVLTPKPSLLELLIACRWPYPWGFVEVAPPGAWVLRVECVQNVGLFNEKLGYPHSDWEQAEYSARARRKGWKLIVDWRIKCKHLKNMHNSEGSAKMPLRLVKYSISRYLLFLPHIWHEMVRSRSRYYTIMTIAHGLIIPCLIIAPLIPHVMLYPLMIVVVYYLQNLRLRSPVPQKVKILAALGLTYMRMLIAVGYFTWLLRASFTGRRRV